MLKVTGVGKLLGPCRVLDGVSFECRLERGCGGVAKGYHCSTPADTCRDWTDCAGDDCIFDGVWACRHLTCLE